MYPAESVIHPLSSNNFDKKIKFLHSILQDKNLHDDGCGVDIFVEPEKKRNRMVLDVTQ